MAEPHASLRQDKQMLARLIQLLLALPVASCGVGDLTTADVTFAEATAVAERPAPIEVSRKEGESSGGLDLGTAAVAAQYTVASAGGPPPELIKLSPKFGPAGEAYPFDVTVHGRGFTAFGNAVTFGPIVLRGVPSADGTTIVFSVPKLLPGKEDGSPMVLLAGDYRVTVATSTGVSNHVIFSLTRNP